MCPHHSIRSSEIEDKEAWSGERDRVKLAISSDPALAQYRNGGGHTLSLACWSQYLNSADLTLRKPSALVMYRDVRQARVGYSRVVAVRGEKLDLGGKGDPE